MEVIVWERSNSHNSVSVNFQSANTHDFDRFLSSRNMLDANAFLLNKGCIVVDLSV